MSDRPEIQLIANLVVHDGAGRILLADYDRPDETATTATIATIAEAAGGATREPDRWWLPGEELEPYEHPDETAARALAGIVGVEVRSSELAGVQSFRGRRGWHVSFDYRVLAGGRPVDGSPTGARWFARNALPRTAHGGWEGSVIERVLGAADTAAPRDAQG